MEAFMSLDDTLTRVARLPTALRGDRVTRLADRDTAVYVEDGWIFRVKPGAPIVCVRVTKGAEAPFPDGAQHHNSQS
jgi:hypothetical protein